MHIHLSSSPNWSSSHALDVNEEGILAFAGHQSVTVLCSRKHHILQCLGPHKARVSSVAFVPYGPSARLVVGCNDGTARCWDWQAGGCLAAAKAKSKAELTAVITPAWAHAVAVFGDANGQLLRWTFSSNAKLALLTKLGSKVFCLAAAPAAAPGQQQLQQVLAGCADGSCVLVDSSSSSQLLKWSAHTAAVQSVLWMVPPTSSSSSSSSTAASSSSSTAASSSITDSAEEEQRPELQQETATGLSAEGQEPHAIGLQVKASSSNGLDGSHGNGLGSNSSSGVGMMHLQQHRQHQHHQQQQQHHHHQQQQQQQCVVTAGADKSVKLWQLLQRLPQQQPTAKNTAAADAEPEDMTSTGTTAATVLGNAVTAPPPEAQLAAAAAVRQPSGGSGSWQQGKHSSMYYGAAALVPGSVTSDGSCVVLMTGMAGGVLLAALVPGNMTCHTAMLKPPHSRTIYHLAVLPAYQTMQQQQQQRVFPGSFNVLSISMDRSLAVSELIIQPKEAATGAAAAATQAAAAPGAAQVAAPAAGVAAPCLANASAAATAADAAATADGAAVPDGAGAAAAQPAAPAAAKAGSKKKGGKGGSAAAGEALLPSLGPASASAAAPAGYTATGCKVQWLCQGLGGYAYAVAAQHPSPDVMRPAPQHTPVRVAVGCGDNTIRVLTLGVRQQLVQHSSSNSSSPAGGVVEHGSSSSTGTLASCNSRQSEERSRPLAGGGSATSAAQDASAAAPQASSSGCSSEEVAGGLQNVPAVCSEVQPGMVHAQLLWRNIQDKVLAVAWHPINPRLLAYGCADGTLGVYDVASDQSRIYNRRHGGPVTHLAWQQQWHSQQQQQQQPQLVAAHEPHGPAVLYSLGGEGCLLSWPCIASPASDAAAATAHPRDVGAQLQQLLKADNPAAAAAAAAGSGSLDVIWSCFAWHGHGQLMVAGTTRGQLLLAGPATAAAIGAAGAGNSSNSSGGHGSSATSWKRGSDSLQQHSSKSSSSSSSSSSSWQLLGRITTAAGLPLVAAAWQSNPVAAAAGGTVTAATAGQLLAVLDRQNIHLLSCTPPEQPQHGQSAAGSACIPAAGGSASVLRLLSCCSVQGAGQLQLSGVAWSDASTVCVGDSEGGCQVLQVTLQQVLVPLHRLTGHMHGVSCLSAFPGWPGLLLSASLDQTVRSWQPSREAGSTASLLLPAAETGSSGSAGDGACSSAAALAEDSEDAGAAEAAGVAVGAAPDVEAAATDATAVATAAAAGDAATIMYEDAPVSAVDLAAPPAAAAVQQQQQQHLTSAHGTATPAAANSSAAGSAPTTTTTSTSTISSTNATGSGSSRPASMRHWKQFVLPGSRSFLPPLPDLSNPAVQQQAQLDVVALAEALYPAKAMPVAAGAATVECPAGGSSSSSIKTAGRFALFRLNPQADVITHQQEQQQQQQQQPGECSSSSVAHAFQQQLSGAVGSNYSAGSWLPSMTADVPELLLQHEQAQQQQQQHQSSSSSQDQQHAHLPISSSNSSSMPASSTSPGALAVNQAAMMRYMLGDVGGFLRAAVSADVMSPDVVALAAAGGSAAWAAAAKLAAAKLESTGQADAAAVYLLAAGESGAAAAVMRRAQRQPDADAILNKWAA